MARRYAWWSLGLVLMTGAAQAADTYKLRETPRVGDQWRIDMQTRVGAELHVKKAQKPVALKLTGSAQHQFSERLLAVGTDQVPTQVARVYDKAQAATTIEQETVTRTLRPERRLQVAQRHNQETVVYSPSGPLYPEELELTGKHLDVLVLWELLPTDEVTIGASWKVPVLAAQSLADLDGLIEQDLTCKLEKVENHVAVVSLSGSLKGITAGAMSEIKVEGQFYFDLRSQRLYYLFWKQQQDREPGPVTPQMRLVSETLVQRHFNAAGLVGEAMVQGIPAEPGPGHLLLAYRDPKGRYEFLYDRGWNMTVQTDRYSVLRLLDSGEMVAQLNVTNWARDEPGKHLTPSELETQIKTTPGFTLERVLQQGEIPNRDGYWIYRYSVIGSSGGFQVVQAYYVVADRQGYQVVLTFTTEMEQVKKFGERDLAIVGTVRLLEGRSNSISLDRPK
jgi:hypothetical protein